MYYDILLINYDLDIWLDFIKIEKVLILAIVIILSHLLKKYSNLKKIQIA